jgi:hypothetical protein
MDRLRDYLRGLPAARVRAVAIGTVVAAIVIDVVEIALVLATGTIPLWLLIL